MDSQPKNPQSEMNESAQTDQSQETSQTQESGQAEGGSQTRQEAGTELIDELTRLGQRFVEVVEVAWNSEERKKIEEDLRTGLVSVANTLEEGFQRVRSSKEAQEAVNAAEDVAAKVRSSKIAIELSGALAQGLRALSEKMEKLSEELREKSSKSTSSTSTQSPNSDTSDSQEIPISREDQN